MLEHLPAWIGAALKNDRAGHAKLTIVQSGIAGDGFIELTSPAFTSGERLPERFTGDGVGVSPPLVWNEGPAGTAGFALIVEDADSPTPHPLVHALVWALPSDQLGLDEGAIASNGALDAGATQIGRNSFFSENWLPPDPPPGHGAHDYVFQLFALSQIPDISGNPGRSAVVDAIRGRVLAAGMLIGTYSRGNPNR